MKPTIAQSMIILSAISCGTVVSAAPLDHIQFLKIASQDARAVIKGADGKLQVIKPGDMIAEGVTVKEIAAGRIVLEEKTDKGPDTAIVRMAQDRASIERVSKRPGNRPQLVAPAKAAQ